MPAILANVNNFKFNSDYPMDKIIYLKETSVAVPAYDYNDITIAHGLGFLPLVNAQWSTTADFANSYNIGGGPNSGATRSYPTGIAADSTNIYLTTSNNTGSAVTLYFRIYGLMPDDINADVAPTASSADEFILNTDYNYPKIILNGHVNGPATGSRTDNIAHGLTYRPQVSLWITRGVRTSPYIVNQVQPSGGYLDAAVATIGDTNLTLAFVNVLGPLTVYYRIYGDMMP